MLSFIYDFLQMIAPAVSTFWVLFALPLVLSSMLFRGCLILFPAVVFPGRSFFIRSNHWLSFYR